MDSRGLYRKFHVARTDGTDAPGAKHDGCVCFVLDVTHDPHALPALRAYAESCRLDHPVLAAELERALESSDPAEAFSKVLEKEVYWVPSGHVVP